jgi:AcrR family transcriptional regulator
MPRSQEQYDGIRKQKKQLIADAALELFSQNGYHATSMSQVAKKAGVSKGLAYNYFESKQEILDEILKTGFDSVYSHFDLNHDGILSRDEFEHFIRTSIRVIGKNRRYYRLYSALVMQSDLTDLLMERYSDQSKKLMMMLSRFTASMGSKNPEGDVMVISSLLKGASMILMTAPDFFPVKQLEDNVTEACFRLISA